MRMSGGMSCSRTRGASGHGGAEVERTEIDDLGAEARLAEAVLERSGRRLDRRRQSVRCGFELKRTRDCGAGPAECRAAIDGPERRDGHGDATRGEKIDRRRAAAERRQHIATIERIDGRNWWMGGSD